jgi:nicotinamidase-related amidase
MKEIMGKMVCETLDEVLDPDRCALLVIDLQNDFMRPGGKIAQAGNDISALEAILPKCAEFLAHARGLGVFVIHVQVTTLPDGRSDSPAMLRAKQLISKSVDFAMEGTWGAEICEECAPLPGEPVVTKHRSSAFTGTNLDMILRSNGVQTVVVIGEQTPGCIEATYRDASYHDYYNVLVEDLVAAYRQDLHEASLLIQKARHDVCTSAEVLAIWQRARSIEPANHELALSE